MATKFLTGIDVNSQRIQAVASPSSATDAVNKSYVDNKVDGLSYKEEVRAATTAGGTLATDFDDSSVIDGVTLATGDRILIKNQSTASENGIYVVAASGAPSRATDANSTADLNNATAYVTEGTSNGGKEYTQTTANPTVDSSNLVWAQKTTGTTYSAGSGLSESPANTFNVDTGTASATGLEISSDTVRIAAAAAGNGLTGGGGSALAVNTGDGLEINADAVRVDSTVVRTPATVVRKHAEAIGNGSSTSLAVTHNLGTRDVTVGIYEAGSPYTEVYADVVHTDTNTVTITFASAPTAGQYRVVVHG